MIPSAYVHIPFCQTICPYCAFSRSVFHKAREKKWLNGTIKSIQQQLVRQPEGFKLETLYFGGGTPNVLPLEDFEALAGCFLPYINENTEWTVECNPELLSKEWIGLLARLGVNRISLGVQTFQEDLKGKIGRRHTSEQVYESIALLKEAGIYNISLDLIYALPGQTLNDVQKDLDAFLALECPHISIYSLQIEENSVFGRQKLQPVDEDLEADLYEAIVQRLKKAGYTHYEISSFALDGQYSRHNLAYWQDRDYFGFAPSAWGRDEKGRYEVQPDFSRRYEPESQSQRDFEAIMMGLRTVFGLDLNQWQQAYHQVFEQEYEPVLGRWMPDYLQVHQTRLIPTEKGMEVLNEILVDFLETYEKNH